MNRSIRGVVQAFAGLLGLCLVLQAQPAPADDGDEIAKLWKQVVELQQAGRGRETLPLAERMLALAERSFSDKPVVLGPCIDFVAEAYEDREDLAKAEVIYKRALAVREKGLGPEAPEVATSLENLGRVAKNQGRMPEAEALVRRSLAILAKKPGRDSDDYAGSANALAGICHDRGNFVEAEQLYQQALAIREKVYGAESIDVAMLLHNMGTLYSSMGRFEQAEKNNRQAIAIMEKKLGPDHPYLANSLNSLAGLVENRSDFAEAERLLRRSMKLREQAEGPESTSVAHSLNNLANLYLRASRYADSKECYERSLAIQEKVSGPNHPDIADVLNNLGSLYVALGRLPEAEQHYRRSAAIREKTFGADHADFGQSLLNLAVCANGLGRAADGEALYKRALAIYEKVYGPDHPEVALALSNLASNYATSGRREEALPLLQRALDIRLKAFGENSLDVADSWRKLSQFYLDGEQPATAEELARKVIALYQRAFGDDNPDTAEAVGALASIFVKQKRYDEAEPLLKKSLATCERAYGPEHPGVASALADLANCYFEQKRYADAEPFIDRAIQNLERSQINPDLQFWLYDMRAQVAWADERRSEAIADARHAMDLAEQIRGQSSGAAHERAAGFARYSRCFERMLEWQSELKDTTEILAAIERGRARGLLDDMNAAGVDLLAGRSSGERQQLQAQELELKSRIAQLEREAGAAAADKRADLEQQTADARAELYKFYRDQRSSSPIYRNLLSVGASPLRLRQLQRTLADSNGVMLIYFIGEDGGFVFVVRGDGAQLLKLELSAEQASALNVDAGPFNKQRVERIISGEDSRPGIVPRLADSKRAPLPLAGLHALWQALIPEDVREQLLADKFKRLTVIPDGELALLPFETLVVEPAEPPVFLLDVGPPTLYAPSATVLFNLATAQKDPSRTAKEPLLTVADPAYPQSGAVKGGPAVAARPTAKPAASALASLSAGSRYARSGGSLPPLPYSGLEARWLAQGFQQRGQGVEMLVGPQATEAAVRQQLAGHAIVHLACHGMTDQSYGNFFGALAFTPGKANDPADDGFLTLPEIYELNLKDCELAILSACQTNYGPQQQGEGVWTLSRGFLVAGARRVVASNWLVDDEAAASLISYYANGLADQRQKMQTSDYATALHAAKRWIRQQDKWSSPYYWGTFELIGPQ